MRVLMFLFLIPSLALAGNRHENPKADADANARATASSGSVAYGGSSLALAGGGSARAEQTTVSQQAQGQTQQQSANATNAGNTQTVNANDYTPRQAPGVAQGSLAIVGCGAGVNGGGSNTHGSAFLGIAWTPADCMALQLAQAYQALGHERAACQVLNSTKAARRAQRRGLEPPACRDPGAAAPVAAEVDLSDYPNRAEVIERDNRVLRAISEK